MLGDRIVSRKPSPLIAQLAELDWDIYDRENGRLCENVSNNFIGSLLLHHHKQELVSEFEREGLRAPKAVLQPTALASGIPVYWYDPESRRYVDCQCQTGDVLIKSACGHAAGIVLNGPLAGLVLDTVDDISLSGGMCFTTLFADRRIGRDRPYDPHSIWETDYDVFERLHGDSTNQINMINGTYLRNRFRVLYDAFLLQLQGEYGKSLYLSDVFFHLCNLAQLPVNQTEFHFTRTSSRLKI